MSKSTVSEDDLARLKFEREEADRKYNDALTSVDQALSRPPELPLPPPPFDDYQISPLNEGWQLSPDNGPDLGTGWRGKLNRLVWKLMAPVIQRQQRFNALLVDHLNRNVKISAASKQSADGVIAALETHLNAFVTFQSTLIQYLQQVTPYINTKTYEIDGSIERRTIELLNTLDAVSDEIQKRWETTLVGEQRLVQHIDELRTTIGKLQHGFLTIRRELERIPATSESANKSPAVNQAQLNQTLDEFTYVGFENLFRGAQEEIHSRLTEYLPYFDGASDVLDLGCGRGEFLALLRESGISARGVDINGEMVEKCRTRGLRADVGGALRFLEQQPDDSLGGLFAAQVVEHLEPAYLIRVLAIASQKLRPGSKIILETINPACWFAFFDAYIRDITHVRPLHPDTLKYLLGASGFQKTTIRYTSPFPDEGKLQKVVLPSTSTTTDERLSATVSALNESVERLNGLFFSHLDYAAIGERY